MQPFHTKSHLEKGNVHLSIQPKENVICVYKGHNLLSKRSELNNKRRHQNKFTLLRHVFTVIFLAVFPLELTFWPAQFMSCIYGFQNRNWAAQSHGFIGENLWGIFPVTTTQKWCHLFTWILLHYIFFVICYIFWLKIAVRHETLSIKT